MRTRALWLLAILTLPGCWPAGPYVTKVARRPDGSLAVQYCYARNSNVLEDCYAEYVPEGATP